MSSVAKRQTARLFAGTTDNKEVASMRIRDIQDELKSLGVSFADCFDRDSLTKRLQEARVRDDSATVLASTDKERDGTSALDANDDVPTAASNRPVSTATSGSVHL
jgi:hypothetical protein